MDKILSFELLATVDGLSTEKAGAELGVHPATIGNWRRRRKALEDTKARQSTKATVQETAGGRKKGRQPLIPTALQHAIDEAMQAQLPPPREAPEMDEKLANLVARMLHAGCPWLDVVRHVCPWMAKEPREVTAKLWMGDALVIAAVEQLQGGVWIDLPPLKRYELAYQKNISEHAYFLMANNFNDALSKDHLEMFKQAREVLKSELKGATDDGDPMQAFARFALEMVKGQMVDRVAQSSVPPDLQPNGMDRMHEEIGRVKLPRGGGKLN